MVAGASRTGRHLRLSLEVAVDDRAQAGVDRVRSMTEGRTVPQPLEQVEVPVCGQLGHLAHAPRRRLHVLRVGHGVDRDARLGQQQGRVVIETGLPLLRQHGTVSLLEVGRHQTGLTNRL